MMQRAMRRVVLAAAVLGSGAALAYSPAILAQPLPSSRADLAYSYAPLVKRVSPAVVNIYTTTTARVQRRLTFPFPGMPVPPQAGERLQNSLGSGVLVKADGLIVTNAHVVRGADEIRVVLADRREFEAKLVTQDERFDLALLRIEGDSEKFPYLELRDSDSIEVGDMVLAIGNPFGLNQTVTSGIVSAVARSAGGVNDSNFFLQTDAAINPGNSGGALVDMNGRLVGINTAIFSRSGGSHGIGFAIPTAMVRLVLESARSGSQVVRRPWFGATLQPVTAELMESLGLTRPAGALVVNTVANSPAARAGLKPGDLITGVDGHAVNDPDGFGYRFGIRPVGGSTTLQVTRERRPMTVTVALERAPEGPRDAEVMTGPSPFQGATVSTLSPAIAEEVRVSHRNEGVVVTKVEPGSPAQQIGLQPGDVVLGVNGAEIKSPGELQRATAQRSRLWRFQIDRQGQVINSMTGG